MYFFNICPGIEYFPKVFPIMLEYKLSSSRMYGGYFFGGPKISNLRGYSIPEWYIILLP